MIARVGRTRWPVAGGSRLKLFDDVVLHPVGHRHDQLGHGDVGVQELPVAVDVGRAGHTGGRGVSTDEVECRSDTVVHPSIMGERPDLLHRTCRVEHSALFCRWRAWKSVRPPARLASPRRVRPSPKLSHVNADFHWVAASHEALAWIRGVATNDVGVGFIVGPMPDQVCVLHPIFERVDGKPVQFLSGDGTDYVGQPDEDRAPLRR